MSEQDANASKWGVPTTRNPITGEHTRDCECPFCCKQETEHESRMRVGDLFQAAWYNGAAWFRIFGLGILYMDHRKMPPLFSERSGYVRRLHLGPHCFQLLTPDQLWRNTR